MYFSCLYFTFASCILVLLPFDIHCTYHWRYIYIYIYMCVCVCVLMYVIHLSFHLLLIFLLYTYVSYIMYAILYFCFTLRSLDEFVCFVLEIQVVKVYLP